MGFRRGVSLMTERISGYYYTESRAQHLSMASTHRPVSSHWSSASAATSAFSPSEHLSSVEWSSGCGSDGPSGQSRWGSRSLSPSDSLQQVHWFLLPGQVPYWPAVSWDVLSPASGPRASPVSSSTGKPRERRWTKGLRTFVRKMWKAVKRPFCCGHRSSVDVVEPFVPPADLDSEPEPSASPGPDQSGVRTSEESFESLFDVEKMIGEGGFGRVYEGTRKCDGKKVAIKRIRKIENNRYLSIPGHPRPLITEVALMLMMRREPRSPFAVQLYDWFEHPRKFTLVMEYPEPCESLLDFMIANPELDEATTRAILSQAVLAVQHCVDHGVFHSDVHPQNFLLREDTMELKLIDFGCGQMLSGDGYDSDTYSGVREYCPPEVITEPRFHAIPANVWALGVMLYGMMNGCFPTHTTTDVTQAQVIFQNPDLSEECMDLIGQCLSLDPAQRPTLEQMLEHDWFRGDPVDWSSSGESSSCDFRCEGENRQRRIISSDLQLWISEI